MAERKGIKARKKISRAGSGGYSLYIPKQWIRGWTDEQNKDKEVDMFSIGDQLVLTPKVTRRKVRVSVGKMSSYELKQYIVSSYVNGADEFSLTSDSLSDSLIGDSRNIVRLLDENLVPSSSGNEIHYSSRSGVMYDTDSLFALLFDKVIEGEKLAIDLLTHFDINLRRSIQILRIMYALEEEDIDRMAFQAIRRLSKCDPSSSTLTDLNVRWMAADTLERIGDSMYAIAGLVSNSYGIQREMLQYPVEYLEEHAMKTDVRLPRNVARLKEHSVADMKMCCQMIQKVKEVLSARNGKKANELGKEISEYRQRRENEFWERLGNLPPLSFEARRCVFLCNVIQARIRETLYLIEGMAKRIGLVYFIGNM
ncbi:MAG: hypothetical protein LUQ27_04490 [Methanomassiliicoccales archaeon]|nr:hypothetical protein [Methanomassiliicoccales archaeon]